MFYITAIVLTTLIGFCTNDPRNIENFHWWSNLKDEQQPAKLKYSLTKFQLPENWTQLDDNRIVGGEEATPHAYPYTIGLSIFQKTGRLVWCGGSLISDKYILSAAHCLYKVIECIVYVGCHGMNDKDCPKMKIDEEHIIIHERFNDETFENDIAIIQLPDAVNLNDKIQFIQLPEPDQTQSLLEGRVVTATGWGFYQDGNPLISKYLRVIDVIVMNQEICRKVYLNIPRESNVCIDGADGKSTCNGDSGGPLAFTDINNDNKRILIGLTSFGAVAGCEKGWPAVFTRITSYLEWIHNHTGIH